MVRVLFDNPLDARTEPLPDVLPLPMLPSELWRALAERTQYFFVISIPGTPSRDNIMPVDDGELFTMSEASEFWRKSSGGVFRVRVVMLNLMSDHRWLVRNLPIDDIEALDILFGAVRKCTYL